MKTDGNFNYFYNNESKTKQEIINLVDENTTVSVDGLNVFYSSPKEDSASYFETLMKKIIGIPTKDSWSDTNQLTSLAELAREISNSSTKTDKILKCVNEHQNVNGRELNVVFPFDFYGKSVIEEAASKREKIKQDYNNFENRHKRGSDVCGIIESKEIDEQRWLPLFTQKDLLDAEKKLESLGKKENEGKLNYELDWEFIQQMAERMSQNKDKYAPNNWKLEMNVENLKQSLFRHVIEVMKGNYSDNDRTYGHLESIALNSLFINYQLKSNKLGYIK